MEKLSQNNFQADALRHQQVQNWFRKNGLNIHQWAVDREFSPALVYAVLKGKRKCLRGQSYQIALALGLKS